MSGITVDEDVFSRRLNIFTNAAILLTLLIVGLHILQEVLQPFFIALGIYFILKPGADALSNNGFPVGLSFLTMLLLFVLAIVGTAYISWSQVAEFTDDEERMDNYDQNLQKKWKQMQGMPILGDWLGVKEDNGSVAQNLDEIGLTGGASGFQGIFLGAMSAAGAMFTQGLTAMFFLLFIIFEANLLPGRIAIAFPGEGIDKVKIVVKRIEKSINTYVVVKTGVSAGTAISVMILLSIFGVDLWFLWGLLTFLFNYVPYIGSLIATIPPLLLGLAIMPLQIWVLLAVLLVVNQQLWGNVIETKWTGSQLDISPVLLLIVVAFAYWLWGILGMIISVPLFVIVKIVLENIPTTRPLAILMSERAPNLLEAYESALEDGLLSGDERDDLERMRVTLGLSIEDSEKFAALAAINIVLREGGSVEGEQMEYICAAVASELTEKESGKMQNALETGLFGESEMKRLKQLRDRLEESVEDIF
ncbi:MAG: AI-2E family transporter [Euryarchaeota archaeon]|nr:AI-2E family transporter [Euryarchaeota archaeon]